MDSNKVKVAGAGLSGALLLWLVQQFAATEAIHAKVHQEMVVRIAVLEARLEFHRGLPTPPEQAVMAAAEASALLDEVKK